MIKISRTEKYTKEYLIQIIDESKKKMTNFSKKKNPKQKIGE